jgi:uncharacterized protein involved in exopolysaccharide biosynthesis
LETLFSYKELFLIPVIFVPVIAALFAVQAGRQYEIKSAIWVESGEAFDPSSRDATAPSEVEAETIGEWLQTESFRQEVLDRTGLTEAVNDGRWPAPTPLETQLARMPIIGLFAKALGMTPPETRGEAMDRALGMVRDSVAVEPGGTYLLHIAYTGPEPYLGQRLVEETIVLYNENAAQAGQQAVAFYADQAQTQKERLDQAALALQQFLQNNPEPLPGAPRPAAAQAQEDSLRSAYELEQSLYESTLGKLEEVRAGQGATGSGFSLRVIDPPVVPDQLASVSMRTLAIAIIVGLIAGVVIGLAPIVLMTWMDGTVRTPEDLEGLAKGALVAQVPVVSVGRVRGPDSVRRSLAWQVSEEDPYV